MREKKRGFQNSTKGIATAPLVAVGDVEFKLPDGGAIPGESGGGKLRIIGTTEEVAGEVAEEVIVLEPELPVITKNTLAATSVRPGTSCTKFVMLNPVLGAAVDGMEKLPLEGC